MSDESAVRLSAEEARRLYARAGGARGKPDSVLGRLLAKLEGHLYRTMTIEEIELLRQSADEAARGRRAAGPRSGPVIA